ncbi:MAG: redox-regulated ATPase YchF [Gammaproteobacteria bacterium]
MGLKCGIVGLPNVGKSSLFNALTESSIPAENFPFCTIEPNVGVVNLPDKRLDKIHAITQSTSKIQNITTFVDIAGLVKGASEGEGLGNAFLANIREVNAILHVVRCFEDQRVVHVYGETNPKNDFDVINLELALADISMLENSIQKMGKKLKSGEKNIQKEFEVLEEAKKAIQNYEPIDTAGFEDQQITYLNSLNLLTLKPVLVIANISENTTENKIDELREICKDRNIEMIEAVIKNELDIAGLNPFEREEYLEMLGMENTVLEKIILASYKLLNMGTFFTTGPKESRAWSFRLGSKAPEAAGTIHTDFQKGFIKAEVLSFEDFISCSGLQNARSQGKVRLEGKDYLVSDGDIVHFKFNV